MQSPRILAVLAAFGAIYLIWGSTYLAIRVAIETLPPFLMAGVRFLLAGLGLIGWQRIRGERVTTTPREWADAALIGTLMMLGGNGLVTWAEQSVPSGLTAVMVAVMPLYMVTLGAAFFGGPRPGLLTLLGIGAGVAGVAVLVGVGSTAAGFPPLAILALLLSPLCWAAGSLLSRRRPAATSTTMAVGMHMLTGSVALILAGSVTGEWARLDLVQVSGASLLAFAYLVVFGSVIALSAYSWLLGACSPDAVATYAFVNPVVAVFLGWALAGEALGRQEAVATVLIVAAVALIHWTRTRASLGRRPRKVAEAA